MTKTLVTRRGALRTLGAGAGALAVLPFLSDEGAAILISQEKLTPGRLAELIRSLDRKALLAMAEKARALGKPEAARVVADRCVELAA